MTEEQQRLPGIYIAQCGCDQASGAPTTVTTRRPTTRWRIFCEFCSNATARSHPTEAEAIQAWNQGDSNCPPALIKTDQ